MFLVKDTLFTALGTLFFTLCYMRINSIVKKQGVPMLASYPVLIALGVCFSLYRNGTKPEACPKGLRQRWNPCYYF